MSLEKLRDLVALFTPKEREEYLRWCFAKPYEEECLIEKAKEIVPKIPLAEAVPERVAVKVKEVL